MSDALECSGTTPKLPPAARRDSFRLSEKPRRQKGKRCDTDPPLIRVSPPREDDIESRYLNPESLPFTPSKLTCMPPKYSSPNYRTPSPTKSPLYASPKPPGLNLGRGSYGNVTLCTYKNVPFAVKAARAGAWVGERQLLGVRHPHLVRVLHVSPVLRGRVFVCMEFAGHWNLQQLLDAKGDLPFSRRLSFCAQVASGLRHVHGRRLVHGDVKPANVVVGARGLCKLGDFGQSVPLAPAGEPFALGTAAYAAPEVLRGGRPAPPADVFSLGTLLWQAATRRPPFPRQHPHVLIYKVVTYGIRPKFPANDDKFYVIFSNISKKCWAEEGKDRPDISQVLNQLRELEESIKNSDYKN